LIRISVGTEHIDDIIADFEQSFVAVTAANKEDAPPAETAPVEAAPEAASEAAPEAAPAASEAAAADTPADVKTDEAPLAI
jgi:hypothetical protein